MRHKQKGYTIIEALLFLAISGALFSLTILGMNGQINRSRFKQNIETIQMNIVTVLDSVDKGYTLSNGARTCRATGNTLSIVEGSGTKTGADSSNCVFYGRDIDICDNSPNMTVSTYLANNRTINQPNDYPPVNMAQLATTVALPSGVVFVPTASDALNGTNSTTGCHLAAMHLSSNENYQKVPRFQADKASSTTTNPPWQLIDDKKPLRWCFQDGSNAALKASVIVSQVNVVVNMGDDQCG